MTANQTMYLVETDWLSERLNDQSARILDVTGMLTSSLENLARERVYNNGHIPEAVSFDVASAKGELSDPNSKLPWTWPSAKQVEVAMSKHGVSNKTQVILYAASPRPGVDFGPMWCTRAWWVLHHFGVDCAVLNGGLEKWVAEGRPVSVEPVSPTPTKFTASGDGHEAVAGKQDVLAALDQDSVCVANALAPDIFDATSETKFGSRKGHITGSVSAPMQNLFLDDGHTFVDRKTMKRRLTDHGLKVDQPAITYCGGGIAATVDAFALRLLGNDDVRVYDASLMEWANDDDLPMTDLSTTG